MRGDAGRPLRHPTSTQPPGATPSAPNRCNNPVRQDMALATLYGRDVECAWEDDALGARLPPQGSTECERTPLRPAQLFP
eukprot:15394701-Alexandrium_andersonii.AAC.1